MADDVKVDLGESYGGTYTLVDGCNGLYIYHDGSGECTGMAGDGSEFTLDDLREFAESDPYDFYQCYGAGHLRQCAVCDEWVDTSTVTCISLGDPPVGEWVCSECRGDIIEITTAGGKTRYFYPGDDDAAAYFYHFGDGSLGVAAMRAAGVLPPEKE